MTSHAYELTSFQRFQRSFGLAWWIVYRHWMVYRKNLFANISPTLSDPTFMLLSFGVGLSGYIADLDGISYAAYISPGLAISTAMMTAFFEASYGFFIRHSFEGVYTAMQTTPIGTREIIIGEFLWLALKGAVMSAAVTVVLSLFGLCHPLALLVVPLIGALVGLSCGAFGLLASTWVRNIDQFQTIYAVCINPVFFLSGIFFPLENLPKILFWIVQLNPVYHGVKLGQTFFWNRWNLGLLSYHLLFLLALTGVLMFFTVPRVWKKLRQ